MLTETLPARKTIDIICTACGLSWYRHPRDATLLDCIALLREELANKGGN